MGEWKQIGGDQNWSGVGVILARDDGGGWVELVRIDPWAELDESAEISHGLYNKQEVSFHYNDLQLDSPRIASVLRSTGMRKDEWEELSMPGRAEAVAEVNGYGGSDVSGDDLLELLPDKPEKIEFWAGKATEESVKEDNANLRREALDRHFDTSLDPGEMPKKKALKYALGGETWEFDVTGDDAHAFEYAMKLAKLSGKWKGPSISLSTPEEVEEVVGALWNSIPRGRAMDDMSVVARWKGNRQKLSEKARELATSIMESLGFYWR